MIFQEFLIPLRNITKVHGYLKKYEYEQFQFLILISSHVSLTLETTQTREYSLPKCDVFRIRIVQDIRTIVSKFLEL